MDPSNGFRGRDYLWARVVCVGPGDGPVTGLFLGLRVKLLVCERFPLFFFSHSLIEEDREVKVTVWVEDSFRGTFG